jgi:putrescine transport system ATP-binding protein
MADELPKSEPGADAADIPLLRIDAVVKKFGAFRAVDRLSLDIRAGEFFALLGPSGCGKTTLLRMLAGFETPDEGRILLNGRDIAQVMPHQRPVNMMFQNYALFPHLTRSALRRPETARSAGALAGAPPAGAAARRADGRPRQEAA